MPFAEIELSPRPNDNVIQMYSEHAKVIPATINHVSRCISIPPVPAGDNKNILCFYTCALRNTYVKSYQISVSSLVIPFPLYRVCIGYTYLVKPRYKGNILSNGEEMDERVWF